MDQVIAQRKEVTCFKEELPHLTAKELFRLRDCYRLILEIVNDNTTKEFLRLVNEQIDYRFK